MSYAISGSVIDRARSVSSDHDAHNKALQALFESSGVPDGLALAYVGLAGPARAAADLASQLDLDAEQFHVALSGYVERVGDFLLTGADALAILAAHAGVTQAFAYAGTSELALCDRLSRAPGIHLINARGDKEAALMAAGAGFPAPASAVAVIHAARGLTNACGAVADARRNELGTVLLVGLPSTRSAPFLPPHGEPQLLDTIGRFAKFSWEARPMATDPLARQRDAAEFVARFADAVAAARRRPFGPALFGVPQDIAQTPWLPWSVVNASLVGVADRAYDVPADPADIRKAAELLASAHRPVILADDYLLRYDDARDVLRDLSNGAGAPVLQVRYVRGEMLFERLSQQQVPNFVGWYDPTDENHRRLMHEADLLITLEDRNMYPRVVGPLPRCRKIALTSDHTKVRKNGYIRSQDDVVVEGDVTAAIRKLIRASDDLRPRDVWWGFAAVQPRQYDLAPAVAVARTGIARCLADILEHSARPVLVDDSSMFGGLVAEEYDQLPTRVRVLGSHGGFVGSCIGLAAGLALSHRDVGVVGLTSDQGFTNAVQGLAVIGQEQIPLVLVVCNNGESVSLTKQSCSEDASWFDSHRQPYLRNPSNLSYSVVARAFGLRAERLRIPVDSGDGATAAAIESLRAVALAACTDSGPALIELILPGLGEMWTGIWAIAGNEEERSSSPRKVPGDGPAAVSASAPLEASGQ